MYIRDYASHTTSEFLNSWHTSTRRQSGTNFRQGKHQRRWTDPREIETNTTPGQRTHKAEIKFETDICRHTMYMVDRKLPAVEESADDGEHIEIDYVFCNYRENGNLQFLLFCVLYLYTLKPNSLYFLSNRYPFCS